MSEYKQAAEQNMRVWARRMGVSADKLPAMNKATHQHFPGSVLKGPLTIVASAHLMKVVPVLEERKIVATAIAVVLTKTLRGEIGGNLLQELSLVCPARELTLYSTLMLDTINYALSQRQAEYDRPSLANMIINHVKGRG